MPLASAVSLKSTKAATLMNIGLWLLQGLLAAMFLFHGWIMLFPPAELVAIMNAQLAPWFRLFVGIARCDWSALARDHAALAPVDCMGRRRADDRGDQRQHAAYGQGRDEHAITTAILFGLLAFVTAMRWKVKPILSSHKAEGKTHEKNRR